MKNTKLRIAWIIANLFLYAMVFGFGFFVLANADGLKEIDRFGIWITVMSLLAVIAIWGSILIYKWIKQGKL